MGCPVCLSFPHLPHAFSLRDFLVCKATLQGCFDLVQTLPPSEGNEQSPFSFLLCTLLLLVLYYLPAKAELVFLMLKQAPHFRCLSSPLNLPVCLLCSTDRHQPVSLVLWHSVGLVLAQLQPGEPSPPLSWQQDSVRATSSKACAQQEGLCWEPLGASRGYLWVILWGPSGSLQREGGSTLSLPGRAAWRVVGLGAVACILWPWADDSVWVACGRA